MPNDYGQWELRTDKDGAVGLVVISLVAVGLGISFSSLTVVGIALVFAAGGTWRWLHVHKQRLLISDGGLEVRDSSGAKRIAWKDAYYTCNAVPEEDDIVTFGEHIIDGLVITAFRAMYRAIVRLIMRPQKKYTSQLAFHGPGNTTISLGDYKGGTDAVARVLAAIHDASVDTAPFVLERDRLSHGNESLPFYEVDRVIVDEAFTVKKVGAPRAWRSTPLGRVHNPWSLIEMLLMCGVIVQLHIDPPTSLKPLIESAQARRGGVPRVDVSARLAADRVPD